MTFENLFGELDTLLEQRSTDFDKMRQLLEELMSTRDVFRFLENSQDQLYASIASAHLKVLSFLEQGNIEEAKREAAAAIRWFHLRFRFFQPDATGRLPKITETFNAIAEVAQGSSTLQEALQMPDEEVSSKFSPGGRL